MLQLDPPSKGLPSDATDDTSFATVSDGVPYNVLRISSPIQYTFSNGTMTHVAQNNYFNNLVVTDHCFQGCISCELVYHPPQVKPLE